MLTLFSFILVILGCINWLLIGLLQYDFVAGIFGYQGSVFSRLIYIIVGIASIFILFKAFAGKGNLNLINFRFKFKKKKDKEFEKELKPRHFVEASKDFDEVDNKHERLIQGETSKSYDYKEISGSDYSENDPPKQKTNDYETSQKNSLFDEMK